MGDKNKWTLPNLQTDDLLGTVRNYGTELKVMNRRLEEARGREVELERTLEGMRTRTSALRAEVQALLVKRGELEEQEKVQLHRIEKSNVVLKDSNRKLDQSRDHETLLRQLMVQKVSEFEADSRSIALRFRALQPLGEDDSGGTNVTEADVAQLQEAVAKLEAQEKAFSSYRSAPDMDALKDLVQEFSSKVVIQRKMNEDLEEKIVTLRKTVQQMREENPTY